MAVREIRTILAIDGQQKYKDALKSINDNAIRLRALEKRNEKEARIIIKKLQR